MTIILKMIFTCPYGCSNADERVDSEYPYQEVLWACGAKPESIDLIFNNDSINIKNILTLTTLKWGLESNKE